MYPGTLEPSTFVSKIWFLMQVLIFLVLYKTCCFWVVKFYHLVTQIDGWNFIFSHFRIILLINQSWTNISISILLIKCLLLLFPNRYNISFNNLWLIKFSQLTQEFMHFYHSLIFQIWRFRLLFFIFNMCPYFHWLVIWRKYNLFSFKLVLGSLMLNFSGAAIFNRFWIW